MRVVQLGPLPPPHGGVYTNLKAVHDLLINRGHEASVIAITSGSHTENVPNTYKPSSAFQLIKLLLTLNFDIVHFHIGGSFTLRLAALTLVCGLLPGKKSVVTFHSGGYALEAVKFARPFSLRGLAFRSLDFLIGVNSQMLEMFLAYGVSGKKMGLILPFALNRPNPNVTVPRNLMDFIHQQEPFLLSVGGLETEYSHSFIIDAMATILRMHPKAGLMIVGSGSLDAELRTQIASSGYSGKVLLVNDVAHDVVLHLIEKADVLLRLTQYDGDSISVREALYLKTPVIATDNSMRPEGVTLVPTSPSTEEVVERIAEIIDTEAITKDAETVNGLKNIEAVLEVYEHLVKK